MIVRAECDRCGPLSLFHDQISLFHCTTNGRLHCAYRCPCGQIMVRWLNIRIYAHLACVVTPIEWTLPAELFEDRERGPALTVLDLHAWHHQLDAISTVDDLVRS